jgi:hypothetical protein
MSTRVVKLTIITDFVRIYYSLFVSHIANHFLGMRKLLCRPT